MRQTDMLYVAVWAIFLGLIFAIIYTYYQKQVLSKFIRALINGQHFDSASAQTLSQLGFNSSLACSFIKRSVSSQYGLSRIIKKVESEKTQSQDVLFPQKEYLFYIEKDFADEAQKKYKYENTPVWKIFVLIIALLIIALVSVGVIKFLGNFAKNVFTIDNNGGYVEQTDNIQSDDDKEDSLPEDSDEQNKSGDDKVTDSATQDDKNNSPDNSQNKTDDKNENSDEENVLPSIPTIPQPNLKTLEE